jgi:VanZ family protein
MPSKDVPDIGFFPDFDKFVHVCLYLGFAWLLCWSLKTENRPFFYFLILLFAFGWGSFMEVSQFLMKAGILSFSILFPIPPVHQLGSLFTILW